MKNSNLTFHSMLIVVLDVLLNLPFTPDDESAILKTGFNVILTHNPRLFCLKFIGKGRTHLRPFLIQLVLNLFSPVRKKLMMPEKSLPSCPAAAKAL